MTNEEAIARIENHKFIHKMKEPRAIFISEALDIAIKALKQKPCEDCISRQAVLDIDFKRIILTTAKPAEMIEQKVKALPSVNPQQRVGHWIPLLPENANEEMEQPGSQCSQCGYEVDYWSLTNYCPNCGAKMVEPQERSDEG